MPLIDQLAGEIQSAMKRREQTTLDALRMLKTALTMKGVEKGRDLDDAESVQVVNALVKQRRDSIEQFTKAGRQELADKESAEIVVLQRYLPAAATPEEVDAAVEPSDSGHRRHVVEGHGPRDEGGTATAGREERRRQGGERGRAPEAELRAATFQTARRLKAQTKRRPPLPSSRGHRATGRPHLFVRRRTEPEF